MDLDFSLPLFPPATPPPPLFSSLDFFGGFPPPLRALPCNAASAPLLCRAPQPGEDALLLPLTPRLLKEPGVHVYSGGKK